MARREPTGTRKIVLPGGGKTQQHQRPQQQPPRQAGPAPSSDLGRAMADLDANAQIRDRSQLPSKVKVITPAVIMGIVQSVTEKFGMDASIDREEFNQMIMQQTQMEMRLQQATEKVEQYKGEYKKVYDALQQSRQMLQQAQAGQAGIEQYAQQYEAQIAELQQRNAQAVDTYMDLQQQLDAANDQFGPLEAALAQRDYEVAQLQQQLEEAQLGGDAADQAQQQIELLQQQLADMEASTAEASEGVNQEAAARADAERALDEANGRITALESELEEVRQQAAEGAASEAEQLQNEIADLKRKIKETERSRAKLENMEVELEKLRTNEGAWLEEKRRLASQLSNETNNRREAEQKLKAIEKGETLPEASKAVEERARKAEQELAAARQEAQQLTKELVKARASASKGEELTNELEQARGEMAKAQAELKQLQSDLGKAGNAAKELGMLKRKFEGVEAELEGLRAAEGKWLEEKRRMAAQLSNETNLRRDLEEKLKAELNDARAETEAGKKNSRQ